MRASASIAPWLPLLKDFLPTLIVLEEKAAELYLLSLIEKPVSAHRSREVVLGVETDGLSEQKLHDHLLKQGFYRATLQKDGDRVSYPCYFREDLGFIRFVCSFFRFSQKVSSRGLATFPDKNFTFLLENPYFVDVSYLGVHYEDLLPQVGRFILEKGLQLSRRRLLNPMKIYKSVQNLLIILDLLTVHDELQTEALNDFLEVRPPRLVKEFLQLLKENGPGTVIWDSAQKLYLERYSEIKIVTLTKWYWKFLPNAIRFLNKQKVSDS